MEIKTLLCAGLPRVTDSACVKLVARMSQRRHMHASRAMWVRQIVQKE